VHSFHYREGRLHCEDVDLSRVAEEFGTPLYTYSAGTILDHYRRLDAALAPLDHLICYAVKANSNRAILKLLAAAGAGFDIVSGGELFRVLGAGGDPGKCTFAGVGKSREEIEYALDQRVHSFNVESEAELECIDRIAGAKNLRAPIALRANPDVDPHTHEYISTGSHENKFGIALGRIATVYERAAKMRNVDIVGVQMHIGSQITETEPFADAIKKVAPLVRDLKSRYGIKFFSIGGGLGIVYESSFASGTSDWWDSSTDPKSSLSIQQYVDAILPQLRDLGVRILLEPGRLLVGNAGVLLTRVRHIKEAGRKKFAIVDAGMNDLIRPALYRSYHEIVPVEQKVRPSPQSSPSGRGGHRPRVPWESGSEAVHRPRVPWESGSEAVHRPRVPWESGSEAVHRPRVPWESGSGAVREAPSEGKTEKIDIVGPVCESGDFFALDREMPELHEGDLLAIMSAGAYGFVMASNYNSRPLPAEVLIRGDKFGLIRERQTWEDLVRGEVEARW